MPDTTRTAAEIVAEWRKREGRNNRWIVKRLQLVFPTLTPQMLSNALNGRKERRPLYRRLRPYLEVLLGVELPHDWH